MAQDITLMGASYQAVPAVTLPKTGGGTASFTDVTDTTATAADVAQGIYFYTAAGVRTVGTSQGGGTEAGTVTQDANGFLVLSDQGESSGGGLEYEEGTVTVPTDTTTNYAIQFSDTHTKLPSYYYIALVSNYAMTKTSVSVAFSLTESAGAVADENYNKSYGTVARAYIGDSTYASPIVTRLMYPSSDTGNSSIYYPRYWATESQITLPASANYKAGGTYKWMAVWE